ncbi:ATP-binding cassette domain-containing protein [Edaphobacter flagellatus]|uniref:ATP-binding cassette domain-containing protein n=1 Tax=Edaphobacter flagellatus TaxID=1933044 RepID=UPI0021B33B8A|nr:ATP-binding cassette domain-containing protein [Edaphobacter flagellatus]
MSDSLLNIQIRHRIGAIALDIGFSLTKPWTVLFGPSGSGKTTVLRSIAGFVQPDEGRILYRGTPLFDASQKHSIPAHLRPVRSAGQTAKLFPHMTVLKNILYGSDRNAKSTDELDIANKILASFQVDGHSSRMPSDLSGGEAQRVSAARTLVSAITSADPAKPLLLLDEPFSGLDIATRDTITVRLKHWASQYEIPVLSVTHDLGEAFQLGEEIIKIGNGRIVQQGPPSEVLAEERARLLNQLR